MTVANEKVISIHYTLKNDNGDILDTSSNGSPLDYIHGQKNIISGLEKALEGKNQGEKIDVSIPPEEAYGQRNESLVQTVPLTEFKNPEDIEAGVQFQVQTDTGTRIATVTEKADEKVTLDMNHPLADETLHFNVEIMSIRDATSDELSHGHVHGEGCDH